MCLAQGQQDSEGQWPWAGRGGPEGACTHPERGVPGMCDVRVVGRTDLGETHN